MLKYIKNMDKLFGKLENEEQKKLLNLIYKWVEDTFDDGTLSSTDFFGYGTTERVRRFISVYTEYKDYFLFQLHYINFSPDLLKESGFQYTINNNTKYVDIKSNSIKSKEDIIKLKELIEIAYESIPYENKKIDDKKIKLAQRIHKSYQEIALSAFDINLFGKNFKITPDKRIYSPDEMYTIVGKLPYITKKMKCRFFIAKTENAEIDIEITWGERIADHPYSIIVYVNEKPTIECYIPKWLVEKSDDRYQLLIPNRFNSVEDNELYKQRMQELVEGLDPENLVGLIDGRISIGEFSSSDKWNEEFINHIKMLIVAAILRAETKGLIKIGLMNKPEQRLVKSVVDVIKNIETFNRESNEDIAGAKSVISNCNYYVGFDGQFASVKFAAWQDVNVNKYKQFREIDNDEFHARNAQKALDSLGVSILDDMNIINQFLAWSTNSRLNVQYTDGRTKIYYIDNIIPLKVRTTTQKKIVESNPEKGNYELWAPSRYADMVPGTKKTFKIVISDKEINVARQYSAGNEIVYGTCSGSYNSIRELIFKYNLKLGDIVYLQALKDSREYRLLIDEEEVDPMSNENTHKDLQSIIDKGIGSFKNFVSSRGYSFSDEVLANYIFSLKTKPFVILSGISGTGKTKIAQLFAEYMCPDEEIEIVQETNEDEIIYQAPKYFVKYNRIVLQNRIADLIQTQIGDKSSEINVLFDGIKGVCTFGYANNKNKAKQVLFSGEIAKYVKNHINFDDYIKIYLSYEDEKETLVFEKFNPQKKVVTQKSKRYSFISVRPDWADNRSLLGFYNPILETYQPTELLKLMLRAKADMQIPYFVILDEMNLAKVEHYFSDFLSCLESRRLDSEGNIISENIILHDVENSLPYEDADGREYIIPNRIEIPLNIYFTGTVNVDETTYMFSPKVLDRANVIEFNEVNMSEYKEALYNNGFENSQVSSIVEQDFIEYFTDQGGYNWRLFKKDFNKELGWCYDKLTELNSILYDYHMHFGYRVIDEIMMYLSYGYEYYSNLVEIDLDIQILQKVLPKMHGNRKQLEIPLSRMIRYCFNTDHSAKDKALSLEEKTHVVKYSYDSLIDAQYTKNINEVFSGYKEVQIKEGAMPIFPRSARKLVRMYSMLESQGYTSFIE